MHDEPLAFLITWTVHGSFLQGDSRWWKPKGKRSQSPQPLLEHWHRDRLKHEIVWLTESHQTIVESEIMRLCNFRGWQLWISNARKNHVHIVVTASERSGNQVRDQLKANCTRALRESDLQFVGRPVWTRERGGDVKFLNSEDSLERAVNYAGEGQDRMDRGK
jgi:REP element-mobilizing transposase RayT